RISLRAGLAWPSPVAAPLSVEGEGAQRSNGYAGERLAALPGEVLVAGLVDPELEGVAALDLGEVVDNFDVVLRIVITFAGIGEHTRIAGHRHRRKAAVVDDGKLREKGRGIEVGVLAIVVGRVHHPGHPKFVDCGGTEDVGLGGADREARIA